MQDVLTAVSWYYITVMLVFLGLMLVVLAFAMFVTFENFIQGAGRGSVRFIALILSGVALLWILFTIVTAIIL